MTAPPDYSFDAMTKFLEFAGSTGLMKKSTAGGYRAAASKLKQYLTGQEESDVRQIDLSKLFQRLVNRSEAMLSPGTLRTYRARIGVSIEEFVKWRDDPTAYDPKGRPAKGSSGSGKRRKKQRQKPKPEFIGHPPTVVVAKSILDLPFPLREDFTVTVQIPRDLSLDEANRLGAFIKTLAHDYSPGGD